MNQITEKERLERIKGRYKIITAAITAVAAIASAIVGVALGGRYSPIENNVNYDNYISTAQEDIISKVTANAQATLNNLQEENIKLQEENTKLQEENIRLQENNKSKEDKITILEKENRNLLIKINDLEPLDLDTADIPSNQGPGGAVKLTSLTILGNNQSSLNYVFNSLENIVMMQRAIWGKRLILLYPCSVMVILIFILVVSIKHLILLSAYPRTQKI